MESESYVTHSPCYSLSALHMELLPHRWSVLKPDPSLSQIRSESIGARSSVASSNFVYISFSPLPPNWETLGGVCVIMLWAWAAWVKGDKLCVYVSADTSICTSSVPSCIFYCTSAEPDLNMPLRSEPSAHCVQHNPVCWVQVHKHTDWQSSQCTDG